MLQRSCALTRILTLAGGALALLLGGAALAQTVAPGGDALTPGLASGGSAALVFGLMQLANKALDSRAQKRNGGGLAVQVATLAANQEATAAALSEVVASLRELRDTARETHFALRNEVIPRLARPNTAPPPIKGDPHGT